MCLSCGCGKPNDDHGDARNITLQDIDQAAQAAGTSRARALENIRQGGQQSPAGYAQATQAAGQHTSTYSQSQAQNNRDAQEQAQPGTYAPPIGHDSGSDWGQDQQEINYQPPENQQHIS